MSCVSGYSSGLSEGFEYVDMNYTSNFEEVGILKNGFQRGGLSRGSAVREYIVVGPISPMSASQIS